MTLCARTFATERHADHTCRRAATHRGHCRCICGQLGRTPDLNLDQARELGAERKLELGVRHG